MPVEWISEVKPAANGRRESQSNRMGETCYCLGTDEGLAGIARLVSKVDEKRTKDTEAWYSLGVAYGKLGRYNDAIEAFRQALRINPEDAAAWYNLGVTY